MRQKTIDGDRVEQLPTPLTELQSADGAVHDTIEDRDDADILIVESILERIDEQVSECVVSCDYGSDYGYILAMVDACGPIKSWLGDNYDFTDKIDRQLSNILGECQLPYQPEHTHNNFMAYDGSGCCLWSFQIGECPEQTIVDDYSELKALSRAGRLRGILDTQKHTCVSTRSLPSGCFESYHTPGGQWRYVVPAGDMQAATTQAIVELCKNNS